MHTCARAKNTHVNCRHFYTRQCTRAHTYTHTDRHRYTHTDTHTYKERETRDTGTRTASVRAHTQYWERELGMYVYECVCMCMYVYVCVRARVHCDDRDGEVRRGEGEQLCDAKAAPASAYALHP
jgi:hypothetical protein